ncbi:MAG: hypothetical protein ACK5P5_10055 [Pseudobdellovibrionaceae bacterium]
MMNLKQVNKICFLFVLAFIALMLIQFNQFESSSLNPFADKTQITEMSSTGQQDSPVMRRLIWDMFVNTERLNRPTVGATAQPPCMACQTRPATEAPEATRGEPCTARNSYLESQIRSLRTTSPFIQQSLSAYESGQNRKVIRSCISTMMQTTFGPGNRAFHHTSRGCGANGVRPCLSTQYVDLLASSLETAINCLSNENNPNSVFQKADIRAILAMFNIESGFHTNVFSPTGAGGIGQLTEGAINDMNKNQMPQIRRNLEARGGLCAQLSQEILSRPMSASVSNRCERASISAGNPMKNLMYSLAYYNTSRSMYRSRFFSQPSRGTDYRRLFRPSPCDVAEASCRSSAGYQQWKNMQDELLARTAAWSHNTGPYGMSSRFEGLATRWLRTGRVMEPGNGRNSLTAFLSELAPMQATAEMRGYNQRMQRAMSQIENSAGEGGSCVK